MIYLLCELHATSWCRSGSVALERPGLPPARAPPRIAIASRFFLRRREGSPNNRRRRPSRCCLPVRVSIRRGVNLVSLRGVRFCFTRDAVRAPGSFCVLPSEELRVMSQTSGAADAAVSSGVGPREPRLERTGRGCSAGRRREPVPDSLWPPSGGIIRSPVSANQRDAGGDMLGRGLLGT